MSSSASQVRMASGYVCLYFGSSGIRGNRDAIDPQAISSSFLFLEKKENNNNNPPIYLALSLHSLSYRLP